MKDAAIKGAIGAALLEVANRHAAAVKTAAPARVLSIEFAPPPGANLPRTLDVARAILAEYEADAPAVTFRHEGLTVTVRQEGAL